jgi:prepilin-type N-terminal cleavage/methylation domain-containing protein
MKKKNGMTLIEIMLSVALISLVMIFVFNILVDLRNEETISNFKSQDQINRSIITKRIQTDILNKGLYDVKDCEGTLDYPCIYLVFKDNSRGYIKAYGKNFYYGDSLTNLEKWSLSVGSYNTAFLFKYYEELEDAIKGTGRYTLRIVFPVLLTGTSLDQRKFFDIEIVNMGRIPENAAGTRDENFKLNEVTLSKASLAE